MTRRCRLDDCTKPAAPRHRICYMHKTRISRHQDPNYTEWTVADEHDVELIIREQRPAHGLTRLERVMVAQGLTNHGLPAEEIARILNVTPRTVYRWRSEGFRQAA